MFTLIHLPSAIFAIPLSTHLQEHRSMRPHRLFAATTLCIAALAGCNNQSQPATADPAAAAPPPVAAEPAPVSIAPTTVPAGDPLAAISVVPNPVNFCDLEKKITRVDVNWDLSRTNIRNFSVWVEAPTQPRKLWFSSFTPTGTKKTGNWVRNNTKFTITSSDGRELTSTSVTAAPCP